MSAEAPEPACRSSSTETASSSSLKEAQSLSHFLGSGSQPLLCSPKGHRGKNIFHAVHQNHQNFLSPVRPHFWPRLGVGPPSHWPLFLCRNQSNRETRHRGPIYSITAAHSWGPQHALCFTGTQHAPPSHIHALSPSCGTGWVHHRRFLNNLPVPMLGLFNLLPTVLCTGL